MHQKKHVHNIFGYFHPFTVTYHWTVHGQGTPNPCKWEWYEFVNPLTIEGISAGEASEDWKWEDSTLTEAGKEFIQDILKKQTFCCETQRSGNKCKFELTDSPGATGSSKAKWDLLIFTRFCRSCPDCKPECCCALINVKFDLSNPRAKWSSLKAKVACGSAAVQCVQPTVVDALQVFGLRNPWDLIRRADAGIFDIENHPEEAHGTFWTHILQLMNETGVTSAGDRDRWGGVPTNTFIPRFQVGPKHEKCAK